MYLVFVFTLTLSSKTVLHARHRAVAVVVLGVGLLGGLSRSALAAVLGIVIAYRLGGLLRRLALVFIAFVLIAAALGVAVNVGNPWAVMVYDHTVATFSGTDRSMRVRLETLDYNLALIQQYGVTGIGLGSVGPQAAAYLDNPLVPESTLIALWLDGGFFAVVLATVTCVALWLAARDNFVRPLLAGLAVMALILPLQYYSEVVQISALLVGLAIQQSIRNEPKADSTAILRTEL
jgi:O-antigen ligase